MDTFSTSSGSYEYRKGFTIFTRKNIQRCLFKHKTQAINLGFLFLVESCKELAYLDFVH